ncbi:CYTH domain-containing protein [Salisediminibacterium selenitireducens]|uniref:CYTH domain-containing protein n=1 Tax=Salisediminibacterium selenitireducens TaxID=85683 RepID=UPI0015A60B08|nr:CYTH domain-containing protein [Salisediminibacterium selenitireducens]
MWNNRRTIDELKVNEVSQEIEIEFKQRLDLQSYERLMEHYKHDRSPVFHQINHYFETAGFLLKSYGSALRIREKAGQMTLTLKQPYSEGLLETHQPVTEDAFSTMKQSGQVPNGEVREQLLLLIKAADLPELTYLGSLSTDRSEVQLNEGLLVLDRSMYFDITDYELEFESTDYDKGRRFFDGLLQSLKLTPDPPPNKIKRFFDAKAKRSDVQ